MKHKLIIACIIAPVMAFGYARYASEPEQAASRKKLKPPVHIVSVTYDGLSGVYWRTIWRFDAKVIVKPGPDLAIQLLDKSLVAGAATVAQYDQTAIVCTHRGHAEGPPTRWQVISRGRTLKFPGADWNPVASGYDDPFNQFVTIP